MALDAPRQLCTPLCVRSVWAPGSGIKPEVPRAVESTASLEAYQTPYHGETLYSVGEASLWLSERGLPTSVPTLNSKRSNKTGPRFVPIGKRRWYHKSALLDYLLSKIGNEVSSTSEMKAARHLRIEDKSNVVRPNGEGE